MSKRRGVAKKGARVADQGTRKAGRDNEDGADSTPFGRSSAN